LFDEWAKSAFKPVRLIGMAARELSAGEGQMQLFADPQVEKQRKLDQALDQINQRLGKIAVRRGGIR
jgi:hypothetical protein